MINGAANLMIMRKNWEEQEEMNKAQEVLEELKEANSFKSRVGRAMKDKNDVKAEEKQNG